MARNRIIYQSETLHVADNATGAHFSYDGTGVISDSYNDATGFTTELTGVGEAFFAANVENLVNQLHRVQSASYSYGVSRTDVNQFGELAAIDRVILGSPTVSFDFTYLLANFANEQTLGFVVDNTATCISGIINKTEDEKNYFVRTSGPGIDAIGDTSNQGETYGFGNGFVTSYSSEASVGGLPTVSVSVEALNMRFYDEVSGNLPSVNPSDGSDIEDYLFKIPLAVSSPGSNDLDISVLRPGDITLSFFKRDAEGEGSLETPTGVFDLPGVNIAEANIQSYNISFDLSREMIEKLGSRFAVTREITFPVSVNLSVDALVGELTTGSLSDLINCDDSYDVIIKLHRPECDTDDAKSVVVCQYHLKNAKFDSQSFSSDIGSNKTVTLAISSQVGGPNQSNLGLFMSGLAPS